MLFESQPSTIGRLIDLLVAGNYRETAAKIVGISSRAIRMWMEKADAGKSGISPSPRRFSSPRVSPRRRLCGT